MYHHPKYYAALRAEKRKLQASSLKQAIQETVPQCDIEEAASRKPQAPSDESSKQQASSPKHKASSSEGSSEDLRSSKPQAASSMIREPRNI